MPAQSSLVRITEASHDVTIDMAYAGPNNFTGQVIYDNNLCYLHPEAEAGLRKAIAAARGFGFQLKILDAFRPHEAQEALWAVAPNPGYIANPAKGSNHTRGVAIDLTLLDADGRVLDMGTPFDTMNTASHHFHAALPAQIQVNRAYLLTIMLEAGFVHHSNEWWHYQLPDAAKFPLIDSHLRTGRPPSRQRGLKRCPTAQMTGHRPFLHSCIPVFVSSRPTRPGWACAGFQTGTYCTENK